MKKTFLILFTFTIIVSMINAQNPFLEKYNTPHGTPPFKKIKNEHY